MVECFHVALVVPDMHFGAETLDFCGRSGQFDVGPEARRQGLHIIAAAPRHRAPDRPVPLQQAVLFAKIDKTMDWKA